MSLKTLKPMNRSSQERETVTTSHVTTSSLSAWYKRNASIPTILVASGPSLLQKDLTLLRTLREKHHSRHQRRPLQLPTTRPDTQSLTQNNPQAPAAAAVAEATSAADPPNPIVALVNDTYRLAPWADLLYASDARWWQHHRPNFSGEKWTTKRDDPSKGSIYKISVKTIRELSLKHMLGTYEDGISFDPRIIHFGGNSGFQLLNLVILAGAKNIGLLGYDMQLDRNDPNKEHFFGNHPKGFSSPRSCFQYWIRQFNTAAGQLRDKDIRVVNLTRDTALDCFPKMSIESFFNE